MNSSISMIRETNGDPKPNTLAKPSSRLPNWEIEMMSLLRFCQCTSTTFDATCQHISNYPTLFWNRTCPTCQNLHNTDTTTTRKVQPVASMSRKMMSCMWTYHQHMNHTLAMVNIPWHPLLAQFKLEFAIRFSTHHTLSQTHYPLFISITPTDPWTRFSHTSLHHIKVVNEAAVIAATAAPLPIPLATRTIMMLSNHALFW